MGEVEIDITKFIKELRENDKYEFCLTSPNNINKQDIVSIKKYLWDKARKLTHDEILYFGYRILQTNPVALYVLRVKFPFVFVDEFQDTSPLQTQIIKLIGKKSTRIIIVGDIAQSIYSFQGAKISDFKDFEIEGEIVEYVINGNRRSTINNVNFCNYLRKSDDSVWQFCERTYDDEKQQHVELNTIKFLMGDSGKVKRIISEVLDSGGVILTRRWSDAFQFIQNVKQDQSSILNKIYNSYNNTPIQIRDEIREHKNVQWVKAFSFIFKLWESYKYRSFADIVLAFGKHFSFDRSKVKLNHVLLIGDLSHELFSEIDFECLTIEVINKFNILINEKEYLPLLELFEDEEVKITVFSEYDRDDLQNNIKSLQWVTSYRLFNEVFSEESKYMTVHQAKGLEWERVVVSVSPNYFDKQAGATVEQIFTSPSLIQENNLDEFTRIYYVACSRAKNELYIHIEDSALQSMIQSCLEKFQSEKNVEISYEFIF